MNGREGPPGPLNVEPARLPPSGTNRRRSRKGALPIIHRCDCSVKSRTWSRARAGRRKTIPTTAIFHFSRTRELTMASQIYLDARVASNPESSQTKKGGLMIRMLVETVLVREHRPGDHQSETVTLPVTFFARAAEAVKNLRTGDLLIIGAHLYGSEFRSSEGSIKRGVKIVADAVSFPPPPRKEPNASN
jgi:hypothetical protein